MISIKRLRSLLTYDPITGNLSWRERPGKTWWNARYAGKIAGSLDGHGYIQITIKPLVYRAHILIWAMVKGRWPKGDIDHRDGNGTRNVWINLRKATRSQNNFNRHAASRARLGKGVILHKQSGKYRAYTSHKKRQISLGYYDTPEQAAAAYASRAPLIHGEFFHAA